MNGLEIGAMVDPSVLKAFAEYGVALTMLAILIVTVWYFMRRDASREQRLGGRLDQREQELREAREAHLHDLRDVVSNNTQAMQTLTQTLRDRPCLAHERNRAAGS